MKNVVITGASSGIGFELALCFIKNGCNVLAIARSKEKLLKLKEECNKDISNNKIEILSTDIIDISEEDLKKSNFKHIDILINNAGKFLNKPFLEITQHEITEVFQTNFNAVLKTIQISYPLLDKSKSPHIINISSVGGVQGSLKFPRLNVYSSSKAALICLTECLYEELKNTHFTINALALGAVQTPMLEKAFPDFKAEVSAEDMANYIYEFSSNAIGIINGQVISVKKTNP